MRRYTFLAWSSSVIVTICMFIVLSPTSLFAQEQNLSAYLLRPQATNAQGASPTTLAYTAENPAQGLQFSFNQSGLQVVTDANGNSNWQFGLRVQGYVRQGEVIKQIDSAAAVVNANRIDYRRSQIDEWYVNEPQGLKQGFTLHAPPSNADGKPVEVWLQTDGNLQPRMSVDGRAIDFVTPSGALLLRYDSLVVFDANGQSLAATLAVVGTSIVIRINDAGATYPITVDPLLTTYLVKQVADDAAAEDLMGFDVNVSAGLAIVGAYGDDNENGQNAGTVYVYDQTEGGFNEWGQVGRIVAPDGSANDEFGRDVYLHAGITATVGAPGDDDLGDNAGSAYLFVRNQGGADAWGQLTKLTADDGTAGDAFGSAVSTQRRTTAIGAPNHTANSVESGAVYVFEMLDLATPTVWTQVKKLTPPDPDAGDRFGAAVVNSGDYIVVGAPGDDDGCPSEEPDCDTGAIYIYHRHEGGANQWNLLYKRVASDPTAGALFGTSVNFSNSGVDGQDRVVVGAPGDSEKAPQAGAAYIFERHLGGPDLWQARPKLMAPDGAANDRFGESVGIGGNIAIIGSPFDDDNGTDSGSAYLFFFRVAGGQGAWGQAVKIIASDGNANEHFGASVDQRSGAIVVGAPHESNMGAAYFYRTPFDVGSLQVASNVEPNDPDTNWEYTWTGPLSHVESTSGDDQTQPAALFPGTYTVTVSAGDNTVLSDYETNWQCTVDGESGPNGIGTTLKVFVGAKENVSCIFTHISPGTITIVKESRPAGEPGFNFTHDIDASGDFTLDDGGSKLFSDVEPGSYSVSEIVGVDWRLTSIQCSDPDGGTTFSDSTAQIDLDSGEAITCLFVNKFKSGITVLKQADRTIAGLGETITYTYTVINDSQDTLNDVVAVDDKLGPVPLDTPTLAVGEQTVATLQHVVVENDLPGPLENTVVVTGTPEGEADVTDSASLSIQLVGAAAIDVEVTASPNQASVDDSIEYTYRITNTGDALLTDVQAEDARLGDVPLTDRTLQPGESTSGTLFYTVGEDDLPGPLSSEVQAVGQPPVGSSVAATDTVTVNLFENSDLAVSIHANLTTAQPGDTITYTYRITNTGDANLTGLTAVDSRLGNITLNDTELASGESVTAQESYVVLESDAPGQLANTLTVQAQPAVGDAIQREDTVTVTVTSTPPVEDDIEIYLPQISD